MRVITTKDELITLLKNLSQLANEKEVIFRGHCDSSFKLEPNALRNSSLDYARQIYPIKPAEIQKGWFQNVNFFKRLSDKFSAQITPHKLNQNIIVIHQEEVSTLNRTSIGKIFNLIMDIMRYHYYANKFLEENPRYQNIIDKLEYPERYTDMQYFHSIVGRIIESVIPKYDLNGNILHYSYISPERVGFEETFMQHYDFPSAALDWSTDPYVALYFATKTYWEEVSINLIKARHFPKTKCFSICSYQQLRKETPTPVNIINPDKPEKNLRAQHQHGKFTYMFEINSFYLKNGRYPTLEDYSNTGIFSLGVHKIEVNEEIISFCESVLKSKNLIKSYLLPEFDSQNTKILPVIESKEE